MMLSNRQLNYLLTVLFFLLLAATSYLLTKNNTGALPPKGLVKVIKILDGDTIKVRFENGSTAKVRYIGINTPEIQHPDQAEECYGQAAKKRNTELLSGRNIKLVYDAERYDRYGRILAYLYLPNHRRSVNEQLLAEGFAEIMTIPPNTTKASLFYQVEDKARAAQKGLWSHCH